MSETTREQVFKNMQHAIVEAINELAPHSQYNDGSVRAIELFKRIENAPIEGPDGIDRGPHRISSFNSALSGKSSADDLFERIEEPGRKGAWWKLKLSYDRSIAFACEQKGFRKVQQRSRNRNQPSIISDDFHTMPSGVFKWNKKDVLNILEDIKQLISITSSLREENKKLVSRYTMLQDEINTLREQNPNSTLIQMYDKYDQARIYADELKALLQNSQCDLFKHSDQSVEFLK